MPRLSLTLTVCTALLGACYSTGGSGQPPPADIIYYPTGLAVSTAGNVLYVANSDFDLQWNGGTIQSYDLHAIRQDVVAVIANPSDPTANGTIFNGRYVYPAPPPGSCPFNPPLQKTNGNGQRQAIGETCAPAVISNDYVRDSAIIGAFATDMQLAIAGGTRVFVPVRGDASLTWADVGADTGIPSFEPKTNNPFPAFKLDCGVRIEGRCDEAHHAGNDGLEPGNTRNITMPGEPYGMAQSEDGTVIAITHQSETETSLLSSGLALGQTPTNPSLQFVLNGEGLPNGGIGIVAVPHDPLAFPDCGDGSDPTQCLPRPAFLETNRTTAEIDLLRYYSDQGYADTSSSLYRPFLVRETDYPLTVNAAGTDSRGIAVDKTPRLRCEQLSDGSAAALEACARLPARVFIANRTPESLLIGEVGEPTMTTSGVSGYNADELVVYKNIPLTVGPSNVYIAPIVDQSGNYALRVFIVCFDSATIIVYDPDADLVENVIQVGPGPYAMAFDPFDIDNVAQQAPVLDDPNVVEPGSGTPIKAYRFAYVGSFTDSFIQVIDLDNSRPDKSTFEKIVFTLGVPTQPVGTQ